MIYVCIYIYICDLIFIHAFMHLFIYDLFEIGMCKVMPPKAVVFVGLLPIYFIYFNVLQYHA
jgi:hypothetical protein